MPHRSRPLYSSEASNFERGVVKKLAPFLIGIFFIGLGMLCMVLRDRSMNPGRDDTGDLYWSILYDIRFTPLESRSECSVILPANTPTVTKVLENFNLTNVEIEIIKDPTVGRRLVAHPIRTDQTARLKAQFEIQISSSKRAIPPEMQCLTAGERSRYLAPLPVIPSGDGRRRKTLVSLGSDVSGLTGNLTRIYKYCSNLIRIKEARGEGSTSSWDPVSPLRQGAENALGRARSMVSLSRAVGIPARVVTGFILSRAQEFQPHFWMEANIEDHWIPFDPETSISWNLPPFYLPVHHEERGIVEFSGTRQERVKFFLKPQFPPSKIQEKEEDSILSVVDLTRLSPGLRSTIILVLFLPLGGLICCAFRRFLGLRCFGYFTAALLAVSFVRVPWKTGIIVFLLITVIGIIGRFLLGRMTLLKLPRLSLLLLFIVVALTLTVSSLDFLDLNPNSGGVLLPMVCLTIMFERFHIQIDEKGMKAALKRLGGTLLVAGVCLLLFSIEHVQWLFLSHPEMEFIVAAGLIFVGRVSPEKLNSQVLPSSCKDFDPIPLLDHSCQGTECKMVPEDSSASIPPEMDLPAELATGLMDSQPEPSRGE